MFDDICIIGINVCNLLCLDSLHLVRNKILANITVREAIKNIHMGGGRFLNFMEREGGSDHFNEKITKKKVIENSPEPVFC